MNASDRKIFGVLFFSIFAAVTGVGIVVPLLPVYANDLGASGLYIGLIFGAFSLSRTFFLPYFGRLSDKKGRKPFIVAGLLSYAVISVAFLLSESLEEKGVELPDAKIVILGVAYLENSDDTRNTPAYSLIANLSAYGTEIIAHDPYVRDFPEAELTKDLMGAAKGADALLLVTKHAEYYEMDLSKLKKTMRTPIIVDGRDVVDPKKAADAGFVYKGIGKGNARA